MVKTEYPYVQVVSNVKNLGFARANNIGMQRSSGKYLCLINSDVVVLPGCVGAMFDFMESHPDIGILGPKALTPNHATARSCMRFPSVINTFARALTVDRILARLGFPVGIEMSDFPHDRMRDVDVLNGWFWMVRKQALQQVGSLDETYFFYAEDIDWCRRFHAAGWRCVFFPEAEAIHYGGGSSSVRPIEYYIQMCRSSLQYWRKYHGCLSTMWYCLALMFHQIIRFAANGLRWLCFPSDRAESSYKMRRSIACLGWLASSGEILGGACVRSRA